MCLSCVSGTGAEQRTKKKNKLKFNNTYYEGILKAISSDEFDTKIPAERQSFL